MDEKTKKQKLNEIKDTLFEIYPKATKVDIKVEKDGKIVAKPNEEFTGMEVLDN